MKYFILLAVFLFTVINCNNIPWLINNQKLFSQKFDSQAFPHVEDHYFTQRLDHMNHQDRRTWKQRFLFNDTFYNRNLGGPVFLQIGGEGAISAGYVLSMEMVNYARQHGALVVALEHRFYGKSQPLPTLATENLQYLTSQQALADAAYFIDWLKTNLTNQGVPNVQFVTFGCSYPGALAAWFRQKYPQHTSGSVAGSAPVLAQLDFFQYLDVVEESLDKFTGPQCNANIQTATNKIQSMLETAAGRSQLQSDFNTCTPLNNDDDISQFMSNLMGNWMGTVQYNDEGGNPININYLCKIMDARNRTSYQSYIKVSNLFLSLQRQKCMDISYAGMIDQLRNVTASTSGVGIRSWVYQTCFEFAYFQTTDSPNQPFGNRVPLAYSLKMCNDTFGDNLAINVGQNVNHTNKMYGGKEPHGSSRILFVNGSIDPWHSLSVTKDFNSSVKSVYIQGTAHCANANPATASDPVELREAQTLISQQIGVWIMQGNP